MWKYMIKQTHTICYMLENKQTNELIFCSDHLLRKQFFAADLV